MKPFIRIQLNKFSEIALHPDLFNTEILSEDNNTLTLRLKPGANELFFKPDMDGWVEMDGRSRKLHVLGIRKDNEWTILTCKSKGATL